MTIDQLLENFNALEDQDDKYKYLIDLGKALPPMEESLKTDGARMKGCLAQVWLVLGWNPDGRLIFVADSDAWTVKGLIEVLRIAIEGRTRDELESMDLGKLFTDIGFDNQTTANRRNGFFLMIEKIRAFTSRRT